MNKPLRRTPMRRKSKKRAAREASPEGREDAEYLAKVHNLPCVICEGFGMTQNSPTEAHHVKSGRFGKDRTPDKMAIPLCHSHHNKLRPYPGDEDKIGYHNAQATWESLYGEDHEYSAATRDRIERMMF
ncbi:hypothetical protein A3734_06440 [Sulfitobacter sp. HI0054]|uniref:Ref family recombination enhancement nuclease n=1 Tax=Sulfitobacter sp. HI0054 TaxID=1822238 RepID=UPI0007C31B48|nr:Ref family recombination enhancement nuclease [Sulfitobacter sp. HI0054]KZY50994.1 hypothetical protein A3734_06440 [Sulfitobacter sp. HI0054]